MFTAKKSSALGLEKSMTGAARNLSPVFNKPTHGFTAGQALYFAAGGSFGLAKADSLATLDVVGFVSKSEGADRFAMTLGGEVTLTATNFQEGVLPSVGASCYLSNITAGKVQTTKPTVSWDIKPIVVITSISGSEAKGLFVSSWSPSNLNFGTWTASTYYATGAIVRQTATGYEGYWRAASSHTSTTIWADDFDSGKWELIASWMGPRQVISQATAFTVGQVVASSGWETYMLAQVVSFASAKAIGMVAAKTTNKFVLARSGGMVEGLSGLAATNIYCLQQGTPGGLSTTAPTTTGYYKTWIGTAITISKIALDISDPVAQGTLALDILSEFTSGYGVLVDGVLLKDSQVNTNQINELTLNAGVTVDGVLLKDGSVTSRPAATQDAIILSGRAGGTGSFGITLTPTTLSANQVITVPNATSTMAVLGIAQTFTADQTFSGTNGILTDKITERTLNNGITVDGVLLKDSQVNTNQINELTLNSGVTVDGVLLKDAGITQDSAITRKSGFSNSIVAGTLYKIGTMTMNGDSRHVMLKGFLWVYGNATIEFNVFIRSNVLPSKNVYYYTVEYNQTQDISIEVWEDTATDAVHVGFKTANASLSARWEVTEIGRSLYDGWTNATTMTVLDTTGLTQITESGSNYYQIVQQFTGGIKTETIDPITSTNSITLGGTGSAVIPAGTTAQRPGTPVDGMIRYNSTLVGYEAYFNGAWGPLETQPFRIRYVTVGGTASIGGGMMMLSNGECLVTGSGTTESTVEVEIAVDLTTVLGSTPANATTYYLYVDRYDLGTTTTLTDSGRKVVRVYGNPMFALLTTDPASTDMYRYIPIGFIRSANTGNAWVGTGATFGYAAPTFHNLNDFIAMPEKYTTTLNTSAVHSLSHGLTAAPQIVELYYWDGTNTLALDIGSHVTNRTNTALEINTVGLTFGSGQYVSVNAFYMPSFASQITSNVTQFKSQWFSDTLTTTVPHGLSDADDIKGYSVIEWNVTTGRYRAVLPSGLVTEYDRTNLYLDWTGFTPSSTLKYQIVTGGHPVPTSVPTFVGGYTKFVGAGPGSYVTLTAALAASVPGDSILVTRGYTISGSETVSISGIKITFMPNISITQTALASGLIVSANDVTIDSPSYEFTASGSLASAISMTGDDCVIDKCRLVINNAGLTVTDGFNLSATSERNELRASIKKMAGTVANSVTDLGADNLPFIRG